MGIFDSSVDVYTIYRTRLQIRDRLMGGMPKDPKVIEPWLRKTTGLTEGSEELIELVKQTKRDLGIANVEIGTFEDAENISEEIAASKHAVGFRTDPDGGLYLEERCIKAMLKEAANIFFGGTRGQKFGASGVKGAKNYVAEHVFIEPYKVWLGVPEPTDVHLFIGHTSGPKGPQNSLTYYEYVERPSLEFDVMIIGDGIEEPDWARLWVVAQRQGLGALRSQGFGTFDIERWEKVADGEKTRKRAPVEKPSKNGKVEPPVTLVLAK